MGACAAPLCSCHPAVGGGGQFPRLLARLLWCARARFALAATERCPAVAAHTHAVCCLSLSLLMLQEFLQPFGTAPLPRIRCGRWPWLIALRLRSAAIGCGSRRSHATTGFHWCLMRHCPSKINLHAVDLRRAQRPDVAEGASPSAYVPPLALAQPNSAGPSRGGRWASASRVGSSGCVLHLKAGYQLLLQCVFLNVWVSK